MTVEKTMAITKPQIETLLARGVVEVELFDQQLAEAAHTQQGVRYVLRRNPLRAAQVAATREDKLRPIQKAIGEQNTYLAEHPRTQVEKAADRVSSRGDVGLPDREGASQMLARSQRHGR